MSEYNPFPFRDLAPNREPEPGMIGVDHPRTGSPARDLMVSAGLDWNVRKCPLAVVHHDGSEGPDASMPSFIPAAPAVALCRMDADGRPLQTLAVHKDTYQEVQWHVLADLADALGLDVVEAFQLRANRVVLLKCSPERFVIGNRDESIAHTMLGMAHDGSMGVFLMQWIERLVCSNGMTVMRGESVFKIPHRRNVLARIETAKRALGAAQVSGEEYRKQALRLASTDLSLHDILSWFGVVYRETVSAEPRGRYSADPVEAKAWARWNSGFQAITRDWRETYLAESRTLPDLAGSLWLAFNAVTNWIDHRSTVRVHKGQQNNADDARRFAGMLGTGASRKVRVFAMALQCADGVA
jgi:hypothetical protein